MGWFNHQPVTNKAGLIFLGVGCRVRGWGVITWNQSPARCGPVRDWVMQQLLGPNEEAESKKGKGEKGWEGNLEELSL